MNKGCMFCPHLEGKIVVSPCGCQNGAYHKACFIKRVQLSETRGSNATIYCNHCRHAIQFNAEDASESDFNRQITQTLWSLLSAGVQWSPFGFYILFIVLSILVFSAIHVTFFVTHSRSWWMRAIVLLSYIPECVPPFPSISSLPRVPLFEFNHGSYKVEAIDVANICRVMLYLGTHALMMLFYFIVSMFEEHAVSLIWPVIDLIFFACYLFKARTLAFKHWSRLNAVVTVPGGDSPV